MDKSIVLSGFMAAGKTSLAPLVASLLRAEWVDIDARIEKQAGCSVAELWLKEGESSFRAREKKIMRELLEQKPCVIACGGGTLLDRETRYLALDRATVVTLEADPETTIKRAGDLTKRPNLQSADPIARAAELLSQRAAAYAECHGTFNTADVELDAVAEAVVALALRNPIVVALGLRTYTIDVVRHQPAILTDALARLAPTSVVVVTDAHVYRARHRELEAALAPLATAGSMVTLAPGESAKTLATVSTIWDAALGADIDRHGVVLAFGGGVVGDLAGFAAATLLRGIRFVQAPTTLLSMVDASVGGKTGFDHAGGKNLIGTFHQPSAVVIDLAHLESLPARERKAGIAEVVKIALALDEKFFAQLEETAKAIDAGDPEALAPVVRRAIELKAKIVRDDEREGGARAVLNLGHTFGHALEAAGSFRDYLHGEAVAAGMMRELEFTRELGMTPRDVEERTRRLFERLGGLVDVSSNRWSAAKSFIRSDKKRSGDRVRLPVIRAVGHHEFETFAVDRLESALVRDGVR